jgi:phospholipase D1/2
MKQGILNLERNCWRIKEVDHLAILYDGHDYYEAFFDVTNQAKHSILIAGWEVDSRVGLSRINRTFPDSLREYFNSLAKKKNNLKIKILSWKPASFLAFGRERFARSKWTLRTLSRVSYINDKLPYLFSSFHEKMILVDNCCAFLGGMDLTKRRWDTPDHEPENPLRIDGVGKHYQPVHDIQFVLTGEIIASLRELVEKRLESSSGLKLEKSSSVWPATHSPQVRNIPSAISRTDPKESIFEIEKLYFDAIKTAKKFILIENQYFTHLEIADEVGKRLRDPNGPEVILIMPFSFQGVFEKAIYVNERNKVIRKLKEADHYNRFRVYYPGIPNKDPDKFIKVHSKLMVIDNVFLTLGSANLNYRSMLVDSEINLSIETHEQDKISAFISQNVVHLLSEHLHIKSEDFEQVYRKEGRLLPVIDFFKDKDVKTLKELPELKLSFMEKMVCLLTPFIDIKYAISKRPLAILFFFLVLVTLISWNY